MSKYDAIGKWLAAQGRTQIQCSFEQLDALVDGLPPSARRHQAWWQGPSATSPAHVQKRAWEGYGFTVDALNLGAETVVFRATTTAAG